MTISLFHKNTLFTRSLALVALLLFILVRIAAALHTHGNTDSDQIHSAKPLHHTAHDNTETQHLPTSHSNDTDDDCPLCSLLAQDTAEIVMLVLLLAHPPKVSYNRAFTPLLTHNRIVTRLSDRAPPHFA